MRTVTLRIITLDDIKKPVQKRLALLCYKTSDQLFKLGARLNIAAHSK